MSFRRVSAVQPVEGAELRLGVLDELVEEAAGEPFTADHFLEYAESKFGALYGLDR